MTTEQIKDFLAGINDQEYHALFMTAVFTGARKGEIMGLKWSEMDFDKKQIRINRTFNHGRIFPPKTRSIIRTIDCPPMLVNELRQWMLKSGGRDEDFLFSSDDGKSPLNVYSHLMKDENKEAPARLEKAIFG